MIKKGQCTKTIMDVGEKYTGKPGRPFIVFVNLIGYFAPVKEKSDLSGKEKEDGGEDGCEESG